ncbi:hypothetical protein C4E44_01975 [Pseudomonas sp. MWU12-2312b]|uniref:hypothetical protein n=1 Tax=Pseudomonas moorei TaxID=395599 RepID=UPI000D4E8181|nr:hypothetical protein [Pseudomonas moorei]PPA05787.1 hypothetical protein C4E44_01975 [Pseudomonas sp. MWU12-2312b]
MTNEKKSDHIVRKREVDADALNDEFVQSLRELMAWYGKSIEDLVNIIESEIARGRIQLFSIKGIQSVH